MGNFNVSSFKIRESISKTNQILFNIGNEHLGIMKIFFLYLWLIRKIEINFSCIGIN